MQVYPKRRVRFAVFAALLFAATPSGAQGKSIKLTVAQARATARAALENGDNTLAIQLAKSVLQADPKDPQAYYIISHAYQRLGDATLGRKAAGYAFRYSVRDQDRYVTAQMAAQMAVQEERLTLAQYWLRRSFDYVPNDRLRKQAIADFQRLRVENPWSVQLRFSVDPSNNVNSGASDPENEIDGSMLPPGDISPSGQALSGVAVNARINASYRLARNRSSETHLAFRAFTRHVILSSEAERLLASTPPPPPPMPVPPIPTASDFSNSFASIGLTHSFRLGARSGREKGNGYGQLGLTYGQSLYGGRLYFHSYKSSFDRVFNLAGNRKFRFGVALEHRDYRSGTTSDSGSIHLNHSQSLGSGAKLTFGFTLAATHATSINLRNDYTNGYIAYEPAQKLGPARVSLVAGIGQSHYYNYRVGFFPVPGGRKDKTVQGIVTFHFEDYDFAGFSPTLTLRGRKTESNVGRFDTEEMTLSIGIRSNF